MLDKEQLNIISSKLDNIISSVTKINGRKLPKLPGVVAGLTSNTETIYFNYKGVKDLQTKQPVDENTIFCYYSCTKAITALGLLILIDQGKVNFDDTVEKYLPDISNIYIVDKDTVDKQTGEFLTPPREPKTKITIRHLLTQTAGFSYPFLNEEYGYLAFKKNPSLHSGNPSIKLFSTNKMPLINEPGTTFSYGHSIDWIGLIIEQVSGKTLGDYLKCKVFNKLNMTSCTFHVKSREDLITLTRRTSKGEIVNYANRLTLDPSIDMGGQGCFGNIQDYLKLMRMWLNFGYSPDTKLQLVSSDLVKYALKNHLPPGMTVKFNVPGFPDPPDGFSLCGMAVTGQTTITGRPQGTIYWSGLANLYYWMDFTNQVGGFWASQIFPMGDPESIMGYFRMEQAVYDTINGTEDDYGPDIDDDDDDNDQSCSKL